MPKSPQTPPPPPSRDDDEISEQSAMAAAAAEAVGEPLTVEFNGASYVVDTDAVSDVNLFEDLAEYVDGNAIVLPRIVKRMIGAKQYADFKAANTNDAGRVEMDDLRAFFRVIDGALGE